MMLTLIPFFDRNMSVSAYSLFTRKNNFLMNPSLLGSRQFDGAAYVDGLELIQELGTTTLSGGKPIFVSLNNISIFSSLESECKNTNHAPILLIDQTFPPVSMYTDRIRELREFGYHFAIRNLPVHCYEDYAPILSQMDYILIDCMPSLGMMTVNALVAADSVIIPSQPNFLSTKGLNLLLRSISKIKRQINPRLKIDGILLTMVDNRTNNAKAIISSLRSTVGENIRVFRSEIPFSVRAAECSLSGESIFSHDRNGKVAAAYEALTKEVTELEERAKNRSGPDRVR